jgi:hypothetical protein
LLLSSFDTNKIKKDDTDEEINKLKEAINRIKRFFLIAKFFFKKIFKNWTCNSKKSNQSFLSTNDLEIIENIQVHFSNDNLKNHKETDFDNELILEIAKRKKIHFILPETLKITLKEKKEAKLPDCFPNKIQKIFCSCIDTNSKFFIYWKKFRESNQKIVKHKYFEYFIISMIIFSSLCLVGKIFLFFL